MRVRDFTKTCRKHNSWELWCGEWQDARELHQKCVYQNHPNQTVLNRAALEPHWRANRTKLYWTNAHTVQTRAHRMNCLGCANRTGSNLRIEPNRSPRTTRTESNRTELLRTEPNRIVSIESNRTEPNGTESLRTEPNLNLI